MVRTKQTSYIVGRNPSHMRVPHMKRMMLQRDIRGRQHQTKPETQLHAKPQGPHAKPQPLGIVGPRRSN